MPRERVFDGPRGLVGDRAPYMRYRRFAARWQRTEFVQCSEAQRTQRSPTVACSLADVALRRDPPRRDPLQADTRSPPAQRVWYCTYYVVHRLDRVCTVHTYARRS